MACFRVPEAICSDIDRACAKFWWGDTETKAKMHWRKWEELCKPKEKGGLGFRQISSFNKAMLAKQVWRCLNYPNLLVARVLRAKYHQKVDILEAKVGSNASFIWRSICGSRDLIKRGLRWKIGKNSNLKVENTAFVPTIASGIPCSKHRLPENLQMGELMNEEGEWDLRILEGYFEPAMAEEIIKVKIDKTEGDRRYWKFDERGKFSVKSCYLTEIGFYDPPPSQQAYGSKEWSRLVWKLKVPPKVKFFFWRTVNDLIPVAANLRKHHVPISALCEGCGKQWGTTIHSLFFCDKIKHVWKESVFWEILKKHKFGGMIELGREMRDKKTSEEYELWVMTLWKVWSFLCQQKHDPEKEQVSISITMGRELLETYSEAWEATKQRWIFSVPIGIKVWKPPIQGVYRIDVDACFNEEAMLFGVGVAIRNNSKELCAAMTVPMNNPGNVLEAELIALLYGAGLCLQEKLGPVVMFSDSLNAVRTVVRMKKGEEEIQPGFEEVVELMREGIILDVCHMYREANSVAHALARVGALKGAFCCWTSNFPDWLRDVVKND